MTIDVHSPFKSAPRISRSKFVDVLQSVGSFDVDALWGEVPRKDRPAEAGRIYDLIASVGHDPGVQLAILGKESSFGTNSNSVLWRNNTRSWTNARSVRHPEVRKRSEIITDSQRRSQYVRYQSVYDSVLDGLYRVDEPGYAYRQARAVSIVDHIRIWAPGSDDNQPDGYARTMVDWINSWMAGDTGEVSKPEEPPVSGLPLRVSHIPSGNGNRPGHAMTPRYITIHETANTSRGANAEMHRRFTHNGGGSESVSFHFVVDDSEIVELLPTTENGWHAGDGANGTGNRESIGIELCVNSDGNFQKTLALGARLVARLMETRNIPIERVVQHNHWSGKGCPANLRRGGWGAFIRSIRDITEREPQQPEPEKPHPSARYFDVTGQYISQGFRDYWEQFSDDRISIEVFGYPLTGELPFTTPDGAQGSQQYFERAVFEWHPDKGRVLLRRLGAEALEDAA